MSKEKRASLPIAVRAYPQHQKEERPARTRPEKTWIRPDAMLVVDTETKTDATQAIKFGSYRLVVSGNCVEEGLFYPPDISEEEKQILNNYVSSRATQPPKKGRPDLLLLTLREFLEKLYRASYKGRCLLVGFNLPFDISRIAFEATAARGRFAGGFSLGLWTYIDKDGKETPNHFRPRVGIKHIDSKRALKGFTSRNKPDLTDLIPEGSETGPPEEGYKFRGHFLDLRTLAFALTDRGHTLESACQEFGVEHGKITTNIQGQITEQYIDYNRRDVLATYELAVKLLEEYDKNPIALQVTKAYSPAAIGKSYLREMGIRPVLERQPDFPKKFVGYAQTAFFGGRTSAHIRKTPVPVVYTDFLSMYPTVNNLMGLWRYVISREIRVVLNCAREIEIFLRNLSPSDLFDPSTWKFLHGFVRVVPDGDVLPSRSKYSTASNDWQVAINELYGNVSSNDALWFSLPDVAASLIFTGRIPKIVDAFRIEACDVLPGLKPVKLRGDVEIDPRNQDFFKVVIEERKRLASRSDLSKTEKTRLDKSFKVLANGTSYGIYGEMIREESDLPKLVTCYGIDPEPFKCRVAHADNPGEFCFPPFASLITGAARLMLALLEHSVTELGGTYAMEDTDSMAIVATKTGGLIPCLEGPLCDGKGQEAVKALSWKQVEEIAHKFASLNPYGRTVVPGSVLKIEDVNFDLSGKQRQLFCLAISAKRYALFVRDQKGKPDLVNWSEHGLGHLLNPTDPNNSERDWIKQVWLNLVRKSLGLRIKPLEFSSAPAMSRISISSPAVLRPLAQLNEGKSYSDQIKPFNFLLSPHLNSFGRPPGADPNHFHLLGPYETNPAKWLESEWIDQYSGSVYRISTTEDYGTKEISRVNSCADVVLEYEFHPEAKCADAEGNACEKQTVGLLQRRKIQISGIKYIGKESNLLEDVETGIIHSGDTVYTEYVDKRRDEWETKIRPALKKIPLSVLQKLSGLSRRALINARTGKSRPYPENQVVLSNIVQNTMLRHNPKEEAATEKSRGLHE